MQHVKMKHGDLKHKSFEYLQRKLFVLPVSNSQISSTLGIDMKAVEACYIVSEWLKRGNPHSVGGLLLLQQLKK
jgi:hypothetical protein